LIDLLLRIPYKFILYFLSYIVFSMDFRTLYNFLELNQKKINRKNIAHNVMPVFGPRPSCGIWPSGAIGRASPMPADTQGVCPGVVTVLRANRAARCPPTAWTTRIGKAAGSSWRRAREKRQTWRKGRNLTEAARHRWGGGFRR
jgi:hypothetical protein